MPFTALLESACCCHTHVKTPNGKNPKAEFFVLCRACAEFGANSGCVYVPVLKRQNNTLTKKNSKNNNNKKKNPPWHKPSKTCRCDIIPFPCRRTRRLHRWEPLRSRKLRRLGGEGGGVGVSCCTLHGSAPPATPPSQWLRKAKPHLLKDFLPNFSPIEISSEMDMRP